MIKMIPVNQLKIGMYINDLDRVWPNHPFMLHCFMVEDADAVGKVIASGIAEIEIDTGYGADVEEPASVAGERHLEHMAGWLDISEEPASVSGAQHLVPVITVRAGVYKLCRKQKDESSSNIPWFFNL